MRASRVTGTIFDRRSRTFKTHYFAGAASRRSGSVRPTSSFLLNPANQNPKDLTTDGAHIWVVNDTATTDRVFRYTVGGVSEGSWTIDNLNSKPTGIAISPNNTGRIWIVDSSTDRIYSYDAAGTRLSGVQTASSSIALNSQDGNPEGVAVVNVPASPTLKIAPAASSKKSAVKPAAKTDPGKLLKSVPASIPSLAAHKSAIRSASSLKAKAAPRSNSSGKHSGSIRKVQRHPYRFRMPCSISSSPTH